MPQVVAIIPARYASVRFPGKPLALIAGKPMIQRVWEGARAAKAVHRVIVATDDARIEATARAFGAEVVLTKPTHPSGTDRVAEAARIVGGDVILNVQGDEPLIQGAVIDAVARPLLEDAACVMATAYRPLADHEDPNDPNLVKVVLAHTGHALYFSRSPIPHVREPQVESSYPYRLHIGIYGYRADFLQKVARWAPTPLEEAERLEQLRVLENGYAIRAVAVNYQGVAIDQPEDIPRAEQALRQARA